MDISTPVNFAVSVIIVLFLIDAFFVDASRWCRRRHRRRREHLRHALEFFALPLDFTDALSALATNVFCQFNKTEDVFLFRG